MAIPQQFEDLHKRYLEQWGQAEEVLKLVERVTNEAFFPSIKELRYAARRVVDAENEAARQNPDQKAIEWHLIEACENCRKARHDAMDSAINFVHEELDKLIRLAGLDVVQQAFPDYGRLKRRLTEVSLLIVESRKTRSTLDQKYDVVKRDHLSEIVDWYVDMQTSIPVVSAIQKRHKMDLLLGIFVVGGLVGLLVSIAAVGLDKRGYLDWLAPAPHTQGPAAKPPASAAR